MQLLPLKSPVRKAGLELDIFYPSLKLGIEYDGYYWHKDKIEKDKLKKQSESDKED